MADLTPRIDALCADLLTLRRYRRAYALIVDAIRRDVAAGDRSGLASRLTGVALALAITRRQTKLETRLRAEATALAEEMSRG